MLHRNLVVLALLVGMSACNDNATSPTERPQPARSLEGTWQYPGYGYIQQIAREAHGYRVTLYDVTSQGCLINQTRDGVTLADLQQQHRLSADGMALERVETDQQQSPGLLGQRLPALPESCGKLRWPVAGQPGYARDPVRDFDLAWHTFNEYYHDFKLSRVDWAGQYLRLRAQVHAQTTDEQLFELLGELIEPLQDGHVSLFMGARSITHTRKPQFTEVLLDEYLRAQGLSLPLNEAQQAAALAYVEEGTADMMATSLAYAVQPEQIKLRGNNQLMWFTAPNNIAYLQVRSTFGFGGTEELGDDLQVLKAAMDEFVADSLQARGVVLDLRFNQGGHDDNALVIASRFALERWHAYSKQARLGDGRTPLQRVYIEPGGLKQYGGPVAVLTSNSTFSAAEVLAMTLRNRPNTTLIGEASGGAFSNTLSKRLTSDIFFSLSNEFYLTPNGEWLEGKGVPVDIAVPFHPDSMRTSTDAGLERALSHLLSSS
ncbi:hypothetical protein GCM10007907_33050 [Chitinimonas prasina]|uniref:Tail specific protease domain-containing protein n=1 Tax=Chitinimonas prasina TaxID=1434937 RepID=A0ABQ5YM96_9NEIS|nr:S41 family peptidase [Chitinimonas prasina]GLR14515.1 hypothetical protein GCM10007907_33050 [Chitinimonas prasina]